MLNLFNINKNKTISLVKSFKKNSSSKILQNGHFTDTNHRISQFADDTTVFMRFNEENLRR